MSTDNDQLEQMLGRDLHRQVDGMNDVAFGFSEVRGRARRIRRNRRKAAGVGVAAALAVIVPVGLTTDWTPQGTSEIQPAPSPDVPVEVARTTLTLSGLPRGEAPAVEYFTPDGVVLPGEGMQALPEKYTSLVRSDATGGWIALNEARDEVIYLSEELEPQSSSASTGTGLTATPARDYVAWTELESGVQTIEVRSTSDPDKAMFWDFPAAPVVGPVGILGPDSVVYRAETRQGTTVGLANPDGTTTDLPYLDALGADPVNGLISVQTSSRVASDCFAVIEAATQAVEWETCDYALGTFSPDGAYVMAIASDSEGLGPNGLVVLDARTGDEVTEFASASRETVVLFRPVWESAGTIVATALEGTTATMVRMGVDGTLEETTDPVDTNESGDLFYYYPGEDRSGL